MYIIKNALVSITRNKSRSLLIGAIILVIACAVSVTLAINNSAENLISSYADKYETEATISVNRNNMMQNFDPSNRENSKTDMQEMFNSAATISEDDILNYANSDYVKSYYYTLSVGVDSDTLEKAEMTAMDDDKMGGGSDFGGHGPTGQENFANQSSGDFTLKGYSSIEAMNEFIEGSYTITDGEVSEDFADNSCLINSELATLNNIAVGDTIKINDDAKTYKLVVSGIYEEAANNNNGMNMFADSVNTIITNSNFINSMSKNNDDLVISTNPTFILTNSDVVENFETELHNKGMSETLTVSTNLDQVENATSTISNVRNFALTFLIITLVIGTIVLLVINVINIRERKYEIGVLRTIGMKKSKVMLQFVSELTIVSFVALLLGACLGASISIPVSNSLLASEISSSTAQQNNIRENFGKGSQQNQPSGDAPDNIPNNTPDNNFGGNFQGVTNVQAYDSIDAVVDFKVLAELLVIGLLLTLISSISAIMSIQKFSPLTILKERS